MKRYISLLLLMLAVTALFASCGRAPQKTEGKISIVTTTFPEYDWVRQIVGEDADNVEITMLLESGIDLHSFQPSASDIVTISTCDMFIYVGGESDKWVDDALASAQNKDTVVIDLLEVLGTGAKEEQIKEGMQRESNEHSAGWGGESGVARTEYDEHVWLSLKNAAVFCRYISDRLGEIDPLRREVYTANADEYIKKLNTLDKEYKAAVDGAAGRTLVFADRFPFRYLFDDYGLSYFAAFSGCSAETEASFETIVFLAAKVDELDTGAILQIESADGRLAQTVRDATETKDQRILTLDSLQSATARDVEAGTDYLTVMDQNLSVLKEALK